MKLNYNQRAAHIRANMMTCPFVKVFAFLYVILLLLVYILLGTWLFQMIVHNHFADMPVRYALFFVLSAAVSFLIASDGYDKNTNK